MNSFLGSKFPDPSSTVSNTKDSHGVGTGVQMAVLVDVCLYRMLLSQVILSIFALWVFFHSKKRRNLIKRSLDIRPRRGKLKADMFRYRVENEKD